MKQKISVIIPAYNEEENIKPLYESLTGILKNIPYYYEILWIDDGSTDGTYDELTELEYKDPHVKPIYFQRNFGKAAVYTAGFENSKGNIIITMDADLQDDPLEIPKFLEELKRQDLVIGWKKDRKDPLITKKIPSKIFNWLNRKMFHLCLHDSDCGFRAMKSEVAKNLILYGDNFRYMPAIVKSQGYSVGEVIVRHHERIHGKSKYGLKRIFTGPFDLIAIKFLNEYVQRPLHLFGTLGLALFFSGFFLELYVLYYRIIMGELFGEHLPALLLGILLILLSVQIFCTGLLGELITSQRKEKTFVLRKKPRR
ncbi:glycosyltransferase family 2 protein [Candidatus Woesearchaeota archaeon]|nr:glycosyltransferase family 2 protein [Candidatus Woesearchaeota archaeon]